MREEKSLAQLREQLINEVTKPDVDYDLVLTLSSEIAALDPEYVRFTVDAGHISRLGRELVAKQETAVSELIKNAYDADATQVELIFEDTDISGGKLTITDNGTGMDREHLIDGFMRLSSTRKIHRPVSPVFGRRRAGRKGIGRFAAQRLGRYLTIITQTASANKALKVEIDWNEFEADRNLLTIASRIEEVEKTREQGTELIIDVLEDRWTKANIERVFRYISDLLQPFPLSERGKGVQEEAPFETILHKIESGEIQEIASVTTMIYDLALAEIEGVVDEKGQGYWTISSTALEINEIHEIGVEREKAKLPFEYLREVSFKAYYYLYRPAPYLSRLQNRLVQDFLNEHGGIRVYRNGFRVLPYGTVKDDWIGLDASTRRRTILTPHANLNFYGFVELYDPTGKQFEETSSREGLVENESFRELRDFVYRVLVAAVVRVGEERQRKSKTSQADWEPKGSTPERLRQAANELEDVVQGISTGQPIVEAQDRASAVVAELQEISEEAEYLLEKIEMLRILASLGLAIGEFTHEVKHRFASLLADAKYFLGIHEQDSHRDAAAELVSNLEAFRLYTSYFGKAVDENLNRTTSYQDLRQIIRDFVRTVRSAADKYRLTFEDPEIEDNDLITQPMHPSEWASILFNLFTNSRKAIVREGSQGRILLRAGRVGGNVYVEFADNGDGIAPEKQERIFDPFFTTTSPASADASEQDELLGTGLGLTIIKDIVTGYDGEVRVVEPPPGFATCFRIEVPAATDEEIEEYYGY